MLIVLFVEVPGLIGLDAAFFVFDRADLNLLPIFLSPHLYIIVCVWTRAGRL